MECPLCDKPMREYNNRYECKVHHIIYWKNHTREGSKANLYRTVPTSTITRIVDYILTFKVQPYHILFLLFSLTFAFIAFLIGACLTTAAMP